MCLACCNFVIGTLPSAAGYSLFSWGDARGVYFTGVSARVVQWFRHFPPCQRAVGSTPYRDAFWV